VPRAAYTWVTATHEGPGEDPLITTNRINDPQVAEEVLARGDADMVSMARPFLADAEFVNKAAAGRADAINTCIACNQACLDHIFSRQLCSCLVNPFACHELDVEVAAGRRTEEGRRGRRRPGGLAAATNWPSAATRSRLFDAAAEIGGQFNLARRIPGKEEFGETLRYFGTRLKEAEGRRAAQSPRHQPPTFGLRPRRRRHRHHAAHTARSPASTMPRCQLHRPARGPQPGGQARWRSSAPAASASTSPNS
jgi:2,4-dienoyl-CoA reductase (NADPH2)